MQVIRVHQGQPAAEIDGNRWRDAQGNLLSAQLGVIGRQAPGFVKVRFDYAGACDEVMYSFYETMATAERIPMIATTIMSSINEEKSVTIRAIGDSQYQKMNQERKHGLQTT